MRASCFVTIAGLAMALTFLTSCKTNNISVGGGSASGGSACDGGAAAECGAGSACVFGRCRSECTHDDQCEGESVCVGEQQQFGCTFAYELGCSSSQPCAAPLACDPAGEVGACRNACKVPADCRLPGYACVQGVCVPER